MNPELRRNLWLELSVHRLVIAPVALVLLMLLMSSRDTQPWPAVFAAASTIFVIAVHFWGTRRAAEAVVEEVRERTWDWQRMSSLSPWSMAWGKLAGSTLYVWYIAALCAGAMAIAALMDHALRGAGWVILGLSAAGVALHGAALAGSIQASRKDSRFGARIGTALLIPVALVAAFFYLQPRDNVSGLVSWYGWRLDPKPFFAISATVFAGWAVLAVHREMQRELKVRAIPWGFPAFALFVGAYLAGIDAWRAGGTGTAFVFATYLAAMALGYVGLFAEVTTAMSLRRVVLLARAGRVRRALQELPLWASVLPLAAVFSVLAALQPWPEDWRMGQRQLGPLPVAIFLMLVRDAGLLVFFALGRGARRAEGATLLYIVLLTGILPSLLSVMGLETLSRLLVPFRWGGLHAVVVMAMHVAVAWSAAAWRWRRLARRMDGERGG